METEQQRHMRGQSLPPWRRGGLFRTNAKALLGRKGFPASGWSLLRLPLADGKEVFLQPR